LDVVDLDPMEVIEGDGIHIYLEGTVFEYFIVFGLTVGECHSIGHSGASATGNEDANGLNFFVFGMVLLGDALSTFYSDAGSAFSPGAQFPDQGMSTTCPTCGGGSGTTTP